ncbi:hypothetical protein K449DRAFT_433832 [Hypoxylon sp. EC38]|nr:hypothetical protein K449DRAFT_433832 [Hypoxylon sp. EC38]
MAGEVAIAYDNADIHNMGVPVKAGTTSRYIPFESVAGSIAISGLYGCSSLIAVSKRGAWVNHMWEIPSFLADPNIIPPPTKEMQVETFNQTVIAAIHHGNSEDNVFGLEDVASKDPKPEEPMSNLLSPDADPHVFLFTPYARETVPWVPNYNNEFPIGLPLAYNNPIGGNIPILSFLGRIYISMTLIFGPDVPYEVVPYAPRMDGDNRKDREFESHRGKALVQYQPARDCSGMASWRVWFEGHDLQPSHQASWSPLGSHQVSSSLEDVQAIQNSSDDSSDNSSNDGNMRSSLPSSSESALATGSEMKSSGTQPPSAFNQKSSSKTSVSVSSPASSTTTSRSHMQSST